MYKKVLMVFAALFFTVIQTGCGKDDNVYLEEAATEVEASFETGSAFREQTDSDALMNAGEIDITGSGADTGKTDADRTDNMTGNSNTAQGEGSLKSDSCYVYVCGAVRIPGVYVLSAGARIYEAVSLAGGLSEKACAEFVNQAETVSDGQMIWIPTQEEAAEGITLSAGDMADGVRTGEENNASAEDGRIDLNGASASELMTLPGIGQSKADSIIAYRTANGSFSSEEEIMNVEGIKEGVYNRIKDHIKVK